MQVKAAQLLGWGVVDNFDVATVAFRQEWIVALTDPIFDAQLGPLQHAVSKAPQSGLGKH